MKSILIKDTTRAQRAAIVRQSLAGCGEGSCEYCSGCSMGLGSIEKMYAPYIDGEMEIAEINALHGVTRLERG
ncbi:MAG: hypothetical protein LIV29_04965 [Denitrobacterium sp.]|jgi:NADH:ubiquinone oxidoreductase subunit F (NADH-binding)|nr:hypothetical protein [Denitrobacterium sp.]MCI1480592.1 hypothetical protein [Eggerthellaceae bacterium]